MLWSTILKKLATAAIPTIIEFGKKIFDKIISAPEMNDNNTVADIEQIGDALAKLRENILQQSKPAIENANDSLMAYLEEQIFILEDKAEILAKYEISSRSVESKLKDIKRRTADFWQNSLNLKISLDNKRCRQILTMPAGERKSAEMKNFTDEVLSETLKEYAEMLRGELENIYTDFESEVNRSVSRIENTVADYIEVVETLDAKDNDKLEMLLAKANLKVFCYDSMLVKVSD